MRNETIIEVLRDPALRRDPDALRERAIDLLRELTGSLAGAWVRLGLLDGEPRPARWIVRGAPASLIARQVDERIGWPGGDPRSPDARWNRRFVLTRVLDPARWSAELEPFYAPFGVRDELRLAVYERGVFVASLSLYRGDRAFARPDVRRLAPLAAALSDALIAAEAAERRAREASDLVLDAGGAVELACESARRMLEQPRFVEALCAWTRDLMRGPPPPLLFGYRVRWTRLAGGGRTRHLLRLEPIAPIELHPTHVLSHMQREIAQLAAAGATAPEIASMLCIALPTVRSHLRQVYQRLEVTSRAELVRAVDPS